MITTLVGEVSANKMCDKFPANNVVVISKKIPIPNSRRKAAPKYALASFDFCSNSNRGMKLDKADPKPASPKSDNKLAKVKRAKNMPFSALVTWLAIRIVVKKVRIMENTFPVNTQYTLLAVFDKPKFTADLKIFLIISVF